MSILLAILAVTLLGVGAWTLLRTRRQRPHPRQNTVQGWSGACRHRSARADRRRRRRAV